MNVATELVVWTVSDHGEDEDVEELQGGWTSSTSFDEMCKPQYWC